MSEIIETVDVKVPKKRGRKPNPSKRKGYFYEEEEQAFVDYISSKNQAERDRIFKEKLYPAFTKMIESIIRRYELFVPSEDFNDTFCDTMSFLITKVNNYDISKGTKVYSYCGTICKNYLILRRTNDMKKHERVLRYDNVFPNVEKDERMEVNNAVKWDLNNEVICSVIGEIQKMLSPDYAQPLSMNEKSIGYALLEILMNWEEIFKRIESKKFNKTSVLYFIKEYTLLSTKEVREGMKKYKSVYYLIKQKLINA